MNNNGNLLVWSPYFKIYDPLKAGSIDGTDLIPHDNAVISAMCAEYVPPDEQTTTSNPKLTLFVGRLNVQTSERQLDEVNLQLSFKNIIYMSPCSCTQVDIIYTLFARNFPNMVN